MVIIRDPDSMQVLYADPASPMTSRKRMRMYRNLWGEATPTQRKRIKQMIMGGVSVGLAMTAVMPRAVKKLFAGIINKWASLVLVR